MTPVLFQTGVTDPGYSQPVSRLASPLFVSLDPRPPMSAPADVPAFSKDHPFPARIIDQRLLSQPGSAKETRHFAVSLAGSGLHYKAGDSLGVFPTNRPEEVAELLRLLGATGDEPVSPAMLRLTAPIPLRDALTARLALSGPTRKFVETLAAKTTSADEQARLAGLLAPESKEVLTAWLDEREFVDLLAEFPGARFTPQEFVDHQRKLMPRLYSIASSPRVFPTEVHLTVAVVRYTTNHRDRVGVATTFLADRVQQHNTPVPVFVSHSHFGVPDNGARDCIMVGPGTGVAPFRAFLQERIAAGATGRNWLFFGDQHRATDFLYGGNGRPGMPRANSPASTPPFPATSRPKIYVQDRMRENAAELGPGSKLARISTSAATPSAWPRMWTPHCTT